MTGLNSLYLNRGILPFISVCKLFLNTGPTSAASGNESTSLIEKYPLWIETDLIINHKMTLLCGMLLIPGWLFEKLQAPELVRWLEKLGSMYKEYCKTDKLVPVSNWVSFNQRLIIITRAGENYDLRELSKLMFKLYMRLAIGLSSASI